MRDEERLIPELTRIAREAGAAIMDVYASGVTATSKVDGSPVTVADQRAEAIVLSGLRECAGEIAVVSEENSESHKLSPPSRFFLVDPLDGTREFLKADGKGAFTVNIALVDNGIPILGVVYAPALDRMFHGCLQQGAVENDCAISTRLVPTTGPLAVASASHRDDETNQWLEERNISETVAIGSSLKFCLLACGEADVYPRFGPTMEWDTAAGHAVLLAAGGRVECPLGTPFKYGKADYRNGPFIARAGF